MLRNNHVLTMITSFHDNKYKKKQLIYNSAWLVEQLFAKLRFSTILHDLHDMNLDLYF